MISYAKLIKWHATEWNNVVTHRLELKHHTRFCFIDIICLVKKKKKKSQYFLRYKRNVVDYTLFHFLSTRIQWITPVGLDGNQPPNYSAESIAHPRLSWMCKYNAV